MASIFPLVWLFRKIDGASAMAPTEDAKKRALQEFRLIPGVNGVLASLLECESHWIARRHHLPFGTSLVVVARKAV